MSDYIPPELILNILARLPSADVLRCTSVCRSWYDLITSSSFMFSHFKLSIPNQETRVIVKHINKANEQSYNLYLDNQTCDFVAGLDCQIVNLVNGDFSIVGSFNGLICLGELRERREVPVKVLLWNPSIRKLFELPNTRTFHDRPSIGFCYIPETNDYKIVMISAKDGQIGAEMYQLSTNSWQYIDVRDMVYEPWSSKLGGFLNGSLHWDATSSDVEALIVSLDMKNEKFGSLMLPSCVRYEFPHIFTFKESLCVLQHMDITYNVWVMKEYGVADSWAMQYKIDKGDKGLSRAVYVRDNGEIVFRKEHGYLVSCDVTSNRVTNIGGCEKNEDPDITSYMESLVLLKIPKKISWKVAAQRSPY